MQKPDLERLNEWWTSGSVRSALAPRYRRHPFSDASDLLGNRQAVVMTGLRRVGKSTILYQLIGDLLARTDPRNVLYFSFEEGGESTKGVLEEYERSVLRKRFEEAGRVYVFLDEVQYSGDWVGAVKRFYDLYPNVKFYLSGSSSLLISNRALQNLAGRFFSVEVRPMTFREFVEAKGALREGGGPTSRLEPLFSDYLTKGGFPEIVDEADERRVSEYVRNSVLDRVTLRDIPAVFGPKDTVLLGRLLRALVSAPGAMANVNTLAGDLGADRVTISRYLRTLEGSLLLRSLGNFRPSERSESRKLRRYYPATTSMVFSIARRYFDERPGAVLETYVVNALRATRYYRKGGREVDAVLGDGEVCVESKLSPSEKDGRRFSGAADRLGAKRKILVTGSGGFAQPGVEVVPAYALEWEPWVAGKRGRSASPA
ncbi:MAG: ATP-binding protein [Nitrososphaerota archaeon]|nr:ATP-binding protein [Nitrososphaerota archaeon]MDG7027300.1 ATP-binding protein [Nitrososphaerota archaeon]